MAYVVERLVRGKWRYYHGAWARRDGARDWMRIDKQIHPENRLRVAMDSGGKKKSRAARHAALKAAVVEEAMGQFNADPEGFSHELYRACAALRAASPPPGEE